MKDKSIDALAGDFTRRFLDVLSLPLPRSRRTYGFEYEFLPDRVLGIEDRVRIEELLCQWGEKDEKGEVVFENGVRIAFEPGGQIEYCSPPLLPEDEAGFDELMHFMADVNERIGEYIGIQYTATGFFPDRQNAPLCLTSPRYVNLHRRLSKAGTRGHEMMKGTAAIHLHAAICDRTEILPLFYRLCAMVHDENFRMSAERRDIWNHTDQTRCGIPPCCNDQMSYPEQLIDRLVRFALQAVVLGEELPFIDSADTTFNAFLYHMTTIFTDVRFNLKGSTLELRTLDSMPLTSFKSRWYRFIEQTNNITN